jgi:hypothetical protein
MIKPKYLITNLVYGDIYARLFLNNHLKSILDETNLPALVEKYDVEYMIFTDQTTLKQLTYHPNIIKLSKLCKVSTYLFAWPTDKVNRFAHRYGLLLNMFHESVKKALADGALLTAWVADLVVAKEFFPRIMKRIEQGHGAVFVLPLRSAAEPMANHLLGRADAFTDKELCALGLECLHPLWTACVWNNPMFTKLPFCLLWPTIGGIMARTFSTTPIVFRPTAKMLETRGMIDGDIPALCENPYWCHDWTDAPVIGVEPVVCYYPPFANRPASVGLIEEFLGNIDPSQVPFLKHHCFYPDRASVEIPSDLLEQSDTVVNRILGEQYGTP